MKDFEIDSRVHIYAAENNLNPEDVKPIKKEDLVIGHSYKGFCRNAHVAVWDGKVFWYDRYKFGDTYKEDINHFEDDDGYDLFLPFEDVTQVV